MKRVESLCKGLLTHSFPHGFKEFGLGEARVDAVDVDVVCGVFEGARAGQLEHGTWVTVSG